MLKIMRSAWRLLMSRKQIFIIQLIFFLISGFLNIIIQLLFLRRSMPVKVEELMDFSTAQIMYSSLFSIIPAIFVAAMWVSMMLAADNEKYLNITENFRQLILRAKNIIIVVLSSWGFSLFLTIAIFFSVSSVVADIANNNIPIIQLITIGLILFIVGILVSLYYVFLMAEIAYRPPEYSAIKIFKNAFQLLCRGWLKVIGFMLIIMLIFVGGMLLFFLCATLLMLIHEILIILAFLAFIPVFLVVWFILMAYVVVFYYVLARSLMPPEETSIEAIETETLE